MSNYVKKALVLGAGGFIGSHMVKRLKKEGYWVRGVDVKYPEHSKTEADEFVIGDLTDQLLSEIIFINLFLLSLLILLMKSTSLLPIWVVPGIFLQVIMMQML